jgi:pyruvate/2-oxoacid:ferredoxin oxidoreductase alpha subunit
VLAPNSAQEMCDFTYRAFEIADTYRMPVIILSDAFIGQMMEPISLPSEVKHGERKDWALYGDAESRENLITSILMNTTVLSDHNWHLQEKYAQIEKEIYDVEEIQTEDAEILFVAYGISSRVCMTALQNLRQQGRKIGLLRLKTLFPFPWKRLAELSETATTIVVVELSNGQLTQDVKLAVGNGTPVLTYNWLGGEVPSSEEIEERIQNEL